MPRTGASPCRVLLTCRGARCRGLTVAQRVAVVGAAVLVGVKRTRGIGGFYVRSVFIFATRMDTLSDEMTRTRSRPGFAAGGALTPLRERTVYVHPDSPSVPATPTRPTRGRARRRHP